MRTLYFFTLAYLLGKETLAQYPNTSYWQAEMSYAAPIFQKSQAIRYGATQVDAWTPRALVNANLGLHFESIEGHFAEVFLHARCLENSIEDSSILMGTRIGTGKKRWRVYLEVAYVRPNGSVTVYASGSPNESAGFMYGLGTRYRISTRVSLQASCLRNHFTQLEKVAVPFKRPVGSFASLGLYWNLSVKPDRQSKPTKVKKLTPRRQDRCLYAPAV